jgi:hypothetical protein
MAADPLTALSRQAFACCCLAICTRESERRCTEVQVEREEGGKSWLVALAKTRANKERMPEPPPSPVRPCPPSGIGWLPEGHSRVATNQWPHAVPHLRDRHWRFGGLQGTLSSERSEAAALPELHAAQHGATQEDADACSRRFTALHGNAPTRSDADPASFIVRIDAA